MILSSLTHLSVVFIGVLIITPGMYGMYKYVHYFAKITQMIMQINITNYQLLKNLDKYDSDNKFIKERRFEVILTSFSSSNFYKND